jgi:polysaccharide biosynthesis transport protein
VGLPVALPKNCASLAKVSNSGKDSTYGLEPATTEGVSLLRTLRRRWLIIVITTLLVGAAAAAFAYGNRKDYESTAKLVFRQTIGTELNSLGLIPQSADADNLAQNDVQLVDSRRVAVASIPELRNRGIDLSADDVENDVTVSSEKTDDVVSVTAKADSAEHAGGLAQVYATTAQRVALDDQKELAGRALANLREQFAELPREKQLSHLGTGNWLRGQIAKMRLIQAVGNGSPQIIQPGYVPTGKAGNPIQTVILGVLFGLMLGVALALLREQGDRRLHGAEEASVAFDAPVLTTVPRHRALKRHVPFADLPPEVAEAFRMLQMKLRYGRDEPVRSVLITSSRTEEGKTTVAWNLACAGVSAGLDVALVETDMRRPTLAERYDLQPGPGVTEVVEGRTELSDALQQVSNVRGTRHGHQLDVLVAGQLPPDPWAVLQSDGMAWILETLKQNHGLVVVDTAPIPHVADAISLLGHMDGVIIAASANATRRQDARRLTEQLRGFEAHILGVVVNGGSAVSGYGYVPSRPIAPSPDGPPVTPAGMQDPADTPRPS